MSIGKSLSGEAVAVPGGPEGAPEVEDVDGGRSMVLAGVGTPTRTTVPARSRHQMACLSVSTADGLDGGVDAVYAGQLLDPRDRVPLLGVDRVGGAERRGPLELLGVDVHAMIVVAPASFAPVMAALPTPPQPITAIESPRPTRRC